MIFSDHALTRALDEWASASDIRDRACAHNLQFDERLAGDRGSFFETMVKKDPRVATDRLRRSAIDYYRDHVRVSRGIPHCFQALNAAAGIGHIAPELKLIRIEDLREPLELTAVEPGKLIAAHEKRNRPGRALLDWFLAQWNTGRDIRRNPRSFSARKDQCFDEIASANWPEALRDKLGLDHLDGSVAGPIPVALMEFDVEEVLDQARLDPAIAHSFCIPTALDGEPNSQFFPTPTVPHRTPGPLDFGCPMALSVISKPEDLIAEVIHPRLIYKRDHITKIGLIGAGLPIVDVAEMRNAHLWALRIESDRLDYGVEL